MRLTPEQEQVARAQGHIVRVTAYAGTGKTASLVAWAQAHPGQRALYLAFNKSVQLQAQERFPRSVTARTGHALAFRAVGRNYRDKLVATLKPWALAQTGLLGPTPTGAEAVWADVVLRTLQQYLASPDPDIGQHHVPLEAGDWLGPFAWAEPARAVRDARLVWRCMQDPQDRRVGMLHDGYLKLFVLSRPLLPFDVILFDEAQDANPVLLQLVRQQTRAQQIFVGDPFQAIYGWRGAIDAMQQIRPDQDLRLTASFRFGAGIAGWATRILRWFQPQLPPLRGLAPESGQVYAGKGSPPAAYVGRSNSGLFAEAVSGLDRNPGLQLGWVGGIEGYRLDWLEDTARLWKNEPVQLPFLRLFADFDMLQEYAETVEDVEWQGRCRAVERWGSRLPGLIRRVRAASRTPEQATAQFATIHKAKGLEWPHVVVLDDLAPLNGQLTPEDQHLWYVAMTRATRQLGLPEEAWDLLRAPQGSRSQGARQVP